MELLTPLEMLCRLIIRAKEMEAQVPANDPDEDPDDVDEIEDDETLSVLEDELDTSVEEEIRAVLDDLADDQLAEVLALTWVGRGTYDVSEWDDAFQEATDMVNTSIEEAIDELMESPLLAADLESGLAAFDYSCEGIGQLD